MSRPRPVHPGTVYLVTRRCLERRLFLRPDKRLVELLSYLIAVGSEQYGIEPIQVTVMSNHWHAILHDPKGRLPAFLQWLHAMIAKTVNAKRGRWDRFWDGSQTSTVILGGAEDVMAKAVYSATNPVAAGLVRRASDWPGLCSSPTACVHKPRRLKRPKAFFRRDGTMPAFAELRYYVPPTHADRGAARFAAAFAEQVDSAERELREQVEKSGRLFVGVEAVRRAPWNSAPTTPAPRRRLSPRVAANNAAVRCDLLARLAAFLREHTAARLAFVAGDHDTLYPAGTWLAHRVYGVRRHPPPC